MKTDLLQAFLMDVRERGCAQVEKRKLLWMLGRSNESKTAWVSLLEEWAEIGGEKDALHGLESGPYVILTARQSTKISEWTL
jgi:hypothetical protein